MSNYYDDVETCVVNTVKAAYTGATDILVVPSVGAREIETLEVPRVISVIVNAGQLTRAEQIGSEANQPETIEVVLLIYAAGNPPKDGRSKARDMLLACRDALRGLVPATGCDALRPTAWTMLGTLKTGVLFRQVWATSQIA